MIESIEFTRLRSHTNSEILLSPPGTAIRLAIVASCDTRAWRLICIAEAMQMMQHVSGAKSTSLPPRASKDEIGLVRCREEKNDSKVAPRDATMWPHQETTC